MIFTETVPVDRAHYIDSLSFNELKNHFSSCKNNEKRKVQIQLLKLFCTSIIKTRGQIRQTHAYSLSTPLTTGGRLYCGNSVQSLPKVFRGFFMKHTTDVDMKNAHPVILKYLCNKHHVRCPMLTEYIDNRDTILNDFGDRDAGKHAYLSTINDNKIQTKIKNKALKQFDNEMKDIQKAFANIPEYAEIRSTVPSDKKYNWDGSHLNRILCMYENQILQEAMSGFAERSIQVQVPMFDGCMITGNYYEDNELLEFVRARVESKFPGLNMVWDYKPHNNTLVMPDDFVAPVTTDNKLYAQNDLEARNLVYEMIKNDIVFCKGSLYRKKPDHVWDNNENNIFESLIAFVMELKIYKKSGDDSVEYSHTYSCARNIVSAIRSLVKAKADDDWLKRAQRSSLGKILFENGYYNFKTQKFYDFNDSDFDHSIVFMGKIYHSFEIFDEDDMGYMDDIENRLFHKPLGKSVGDYFILNIARGLAGDMMKRIILGLGGTNTGKSVLTIAISMSFGDYFGSFNAENLAYRNTGSDEAQIMRPFMLLSEKRIIISNELKTTSDLNGNMIKKISSGGDTIIGRNHCEAEREFIMKPLTICFANDMPKIKPYDDAVEGRINVVSYVKQYVDEPSNEFELKKDLGIEREMATLRFQRCFIGLLIREYNNMIQNGLPEIPTEVLKAKEDWISSDKSIIDSFAIDFELTNDEEDYVVCHDIESWIKSNNHGITMKKFGMEIAKYKNVNKLEHINSIRKKIKGKCVQVWTGIKVIDEFEE